MPFPLLVLFAPAVLAFEFVHLVLAERYLGVKQIERGTDPRTAPMSEGLACGWTLAIALSWLWMMALLVSGFGRAQVACMLGISLGGYILRRTCAMKWVLIILTLEGALRIGMLISLIMTAWKQF